MTEVTKRDGNIVAFDSNKIYMAIYKAMKFGSGIVNTIIASEIAHEIEMECADVDSISIQQIEKMVFNKLIKKDQELTAKAYESYRAVQEYKRNRTHVDKEVEGIVDGTNKEVVDENSNKNVYISSTQRDLIAGEYSKDYTRRNLLPENIIYAHDQGILHYHDMDYFIEKKINCCVLDLWDMLQNGTVINGKMIEMPKSFRVACTVSTQIVQQISNGQYGGQTFSITHLAPFVRISFQKHLKKYLKRGCSEEVAAAWAKEDLETEIRDGVQTIQYQLNTFSTVNGQSPFVSIFIYINEDPEYREETVMIAKEILLQRIQGLKNEQGVYIPPSFPKLLYVLDENNTYEGSEYFWLTQLAAQCTAKRMVPDYISAKIMRQQYDGEVFPCMGCVDGQEIITYTYKGKMYVEAFERMWEHLSEDFSIQCQYGIPSNPNKYMDLNGVKIYDTKKKGFVETRRIIKNVSKEWALVTMSNGRILNCTTDHPFATGRGRVLAKDLNIGDKVTINHEQVTGHSVYQLNEDYAWLQGVMLCDGSIASTPTACFSLNDENDIVSELKKTADMIFGIDSKIKEQHRGIKGEYKEVSMPSRRLQYELIRDFEGIPKEHRHIPNQIFSMDESVRMAFLAGMVDADGYLNSTGTIDKIQLGSTNKELALQQMALMQSLGMSAYVYRNHYTSSNPVKIRYRVECVPSDELVNALRCEKKRQMFTNNVRTNNSVCMTEEAEITSVEFMNEEKYSYDVTTESDHFEVSGIYSHNCRSFLQPYKDPKTGKYKWYGRFNKGVVTINLVDVALSARKDKESFWKILDERLELCKEALLIRVDRLKNTSTDISPIHWKYGGLSRLKGDNFNELLYHDYSSLSLGYAGIFECVMALINQSHTTKEGRELALEIMLHMKNKCAEWNKEYDLGFSLYGTPLENTTYKFARKLKERFGVIEGITDHDYITNSYHVNVREEISPFDKLSFESEFQSISSGGCISYVESANMQDNPEALIPVLQHIYENIRYAEINSKIDYCHVCGSHNEMKVDEDMQWYCPTCGNRDKKKMNVCRRTCGYLGDNFWSKGRTQEINERYMHIDNKDLDLSNMS